MEVEDVVVRLQPMLYIVGSIEGWRKPSHACHYCTGEPVSNLVALLEFYTKNRSIRWLLPMDFRLCEPCIVK